MSKNTFLLQVLMAAVAASALIPLCSAKAARTLPEYTAEEAAKHIGEKATVVGKVECIDAGRTFHALDLDGCMPNSPFWIIVKDDASGAELNIQDLKGVTIAVTGKIERPQTQPWLVVKSTTQIQPRSALNTDYISRAHQKEADGDVDGAIELFGRAIKHQPDRRNEAYEFRGRAKERKADWNGALADYDSLVALDPNNANSYYVRATAKKQHGDFEGAMGDYEKAAELRSSPSDYIQMGNWRKEKGDITGAAAEYDKAIALCDRQIAGTAKIDPRSPLGSDPYFSRGCARELKGDLDGAVADYSQAIVNNPARAAMAYGARGNIRRARGDLSGAIADYQHKYQITQYPDDKQKLEQAKAEAKAGAKKVVVTRPSVQAAQNEQSFNKSEVTPESIAEAFVQAYSGADVDALAGLYGDRVDYTNSGVISNADVRAQAKEYFARWPVRQWSLAGPVKTTSMGPSRQKVIFSASYDASDPRTNKHASGIAQETLILASDKSGAMKIVSQREQTSKRGSSQPGEGTSEDLGLNAAKAEASKKQTVANPSQTNAPAQAETGGKQTSPDCTSDPKSVWSEASPDKRLLATIRFVPNPDQNWRAIDELKVTVFRRGRDGKPGQILASTTIGGRWLQCAHWSPGSQFLLFTTSPSRGGHGGWHFETFVYCAGDHSFRGDLEDVFGNVLAPNFRFESPDIAVLTVSDDQASSTAGEEPPTKQVRVSLGKVVDKLDRLP